MEEEKIKSEKPRINARLWRKEHKTQKIKKKVRLWRKEEKQGNTEIPRKSEFMEVKRGGKRKKTENPRKSEVMEERKRKYRNIKKKQEDGKKSLKKKGKLWRNGKTQKKDGVMLKVNERWLQK